MNLARFLYGNNRVKPQLHYRLLHAVGAFLDRYWKVRPNWTAVQIILVPRFGLNRQSRSETWDWTGVDRSWPDQTEAFRKSWTSEEYKMDLHIVNLVHVLFRRLCVESSWHAPKQTILGFSAKKVRKNHNEYKEKGKNWKHLTIFGPVPDWRSGSRGCDWTASPSPRLRTGLEPDFSNVYFPIKPPLLTNASHAVVASCWLHRIIRSCTKVC